MVTTIYLIRHGEAMGNVNGIFQGHTDCEISSKGKIQLECLKERCKEIEYDVIFSSPLKRAIETAEAVNFYHDLPIQTDKGLMEINGGIFEGKKWDELPNLYPEAYDLWTNQHSKFTVEDGESMESVFNRITLTVTKLAARNRGKKIAIVSHGCAIRNFLCYANDKTIDEIDEQKRKLNERFINNPKAVFIDTTEGTVDECVNKMLKECNAIMRKRRKW